MSKRIKLETKYLADFIAPDEYKAITPFIDGADKLIENKSGLGCDFLGWANLPYDYDKDEFARIKECAKRIREDSQVLLVIGIGGSYLGARTVIELCKTPNYNLIRDNGPEIYFIGNSLSGSNLSEILALCKNKDVSVNVISKSGTTTEPAVAFRIVKKMMAEKYGKDAYKRIYATTDKKKGTLHDMSLKEGYEMFVVPDDVGGRYSVLTACGLLPIAAAGIDIDRLMKGAQEAVDECSSKDYLNNDCYQYAAIRNILYSKGYTSEISVGYEPALWCMNEWIKQLHGESEGKSGKGIFPNGMIYSTDLHSLGQYVQQGLRNLFETTIWIKNADKDLTVESDPDNADGLNFLAGKTLQEINENAFKGTVLAHVSGGVPNVVLEMEDRSEESVGYLLYFFERSCAVSGYLSNVNPFDQPGVEAYKKNMFALLGKPGYEAMKAELENKLK